MTDPSQAAREAAEPVAWMYHMPDDLKHGWQRYEFKRRIQSYEGMSCIEEDAGMIETPLYAAPPDTAASVRISAGDKDRGNPVERPDTAAQLAEARAEIADLKAALDAVGYFDEDGDYWRLTKALAPKPADPRYGRVHTDGSRSGGQPPKADSQLVEVVAKAICRQPGSLCVGFCHSKRCAKAVELHGEDARAAIAALQPHLSADAERERIVAWLRGIRMPEDDWTAEYIADLIERGAHREAGE